MIILITGTPGTGKTSITSILSDKTKCKPVNLSKLVLDEELAVPDPSGRETLVLDKVEYLVKRLDRLLEKEKCLIIDTHYPSIIQPLASKLELVVVLRTQPQILYERLTRRKWSPRKVVENVEAEFIGIVRSEVDELNL
nr:AAA family ATPase [Desulfurococcales archaeon]